MLYSCRSNISLKQPLRSATVVHKNPAFLGDVKQLVEYVKDELNVHEVKVRIGVSLALLLFAEFVRTVVCACVRTVLCQRG